MEMNQINQTEECAPAEYSEHPVFYSGTILHNLGTCLVRKNGKLTFDKSREPNHENPPMYFSSNAETAAFHGIKTAIKTSTGEPVIIEGYPEKSYTSDPRGRERKTYITWGDFIVTGIFVPSGELKNPDVASAYFLNRENVMEKFKRKGAEFLEELVRSVN